MSNVIILFFNFIKVIFNFIEETYREKNSSINDIKLLLPEDIVSQYLKVGGSKLSMIF